MVDKIKSLPCGCQYQKEEQIIIRIKECLKHKKKRLWKRPYRAKAESVRP
jgi:predicted metalloprotease